MSVFKTLAAALTINLLSTVPSFSAGTRAVLLTDKIGVLVSENNGKSWNRFTEGSPEISPHFR